MIFDQLELGQMLSEEVEVKGEEDEREKVEKFLTFVEMGLATT